MASIRDANYRADAKKSIGYRRDLAFDFRLAASREQMNGWSRLPLDVQYLILIQPPLLPFAPYVPGELGRRASIVYLERYGSAPIKTSEMLSYFREVQPEKIALFRELPNPERFTGADSYHEMNVDVVERRGASFSERLGYAHLYIDREPIGLTGTFWLDTQALETAEGYEPTLVEIEYKMSSCFELDLVSQYRILKRRTNCHRLDPRWALERVKARFEAVVGHLFTSWSPYAVLNQLKLFLWLHAQLRAAANFPVHRIIEIDVPGVSAQNGEIIIRAEPLSVENRALVEKVLQRNREMIEQLRTLIAGWN